MPDAVLTCVESRAWCTGFQCCLCSPWPLQPWASEGALAPSPVGALSLSSGPVLLWSHTGLALALVSLHQRQALCTWLLGWGVSKLAWTRVCDLSWAGKCFPLLLQGWPAPVWNGRRILSPSWLPVFPSVQAFSRHKRFLPWSQVKRAFYPQSKPEGFLLLFFSQN